MTAETDARTPAQEVAESLLQQLMHQPEQLKLFEPDPYAHVSLNGLARLREQYTDSLVLESKTVERFRYIAAMHGAGFHASQFDEISWEETGESGTAVYVGLLGEVSTRQLRTVRGRSNRMRDEISEELFTKHVPTTKYDLSTGAYITSDVDLRKIFEFDYENLQACKLLDMDLLYEREV